MKTITLSILAIILGVMLFSCNAKPKQQNVDNQAKDSIEAAQALQKIIDEKNELFRQDSIEYTQIKKYSVKKLAGKHKNGGSTKIDYESLPQMINQIIAQSKKEMWKDEDLKDKIDMLNRSLKNGWIIFEIERNTQFESEGDNFTIIIKDINENELQRKVLKAASELSISGKHWWNFETIPIESRIKLPFYVYVVDKYGDEPFKFEVTAIKK